VVAAAAEAQQQRARRARRRVAALAVAAAAVEQEAGRARRAHDRAGGGRCGRWCRVNCCRAAPGAAGATGGGARRAPRRARAALGRYRAGLCAPAGRLVCPRAAGALVAGLPGDRRGRARVVARYMWGGRFVVECRGADCSLRALRREQEARRRAARAAAEHGRAAQPHCAAPAPPASPSPACPSRRRTAGTSPLGWASGQRGVGTRSRHGPVNALCWQAVCSGGSSLGAGHRERATLRRQAQRYARAGDGGPLARKGLGGPRRPWRRAAPAPAASGGTGGAGSAEATSAPSAGPD
jgi:hypothetical protein